MTNIDYWFRISLPGRDPFNICVRHGVVIKSTPMQKWMIEKLFYIVAKWIRRRKGSFKMIKKQHYAL